MFKTNFTEVYIMAWISHPVILDSGHATTGAMLVSVQCFYRVRPLRFPGEAKSLAKYWEFSDHSSSLQFEWHFPTISSITWISFLSLLNMYFKFESKIPALWYQP